MNAFGGFQNPLEFLGGNQCRGAKPRGNFFGKSNLVDYVDFSWNSLVAELKLWSAFQAEMKAFGSN